MKKQSFFVLCFALFFINSQSWAAVPATIDFETVGNTWTWTLFSNGTSQPTDFSIVPNPQIAGVNTSTSCAKLIVNADAARWAGVYTYDFPSTTLDATNCIIKIKVKKDVVSNFHLELNGPNGEGEDVDFVEVTNTSITGWEELTFDFSAFIGHTYAFMKIIPDFSASARNYASTSYWDNISFNPQPPVAPVGLIDFETVGNTWAWTMFANGAAPATDFSGTAANPLTTGINSSAHCAKLVVAANASLWAGVYTFNFPSKTLDATNCVIKVMVYKNVLSNFHVELNGPNGEGADNDLVKVTNTTTAGWEELTFDFSAFIGNTYAFLKIIPDFPATRTSGSINYWDNISFNPQPPAPPQGFIDFETVGNTWKWTVASNGPSQAPTDFSVVPNPLPSGINTSAHCAKLVARADAALFPSASTLNFPSTTLDATNCIIKVMVYKDVLSKFQMELKGPKAGGKAVYDKVGVSNTSTSGWEELTFDFTAYIGKTYNNMIVIPDFAVGVGTPATRNYGSTNYWDNISFGPNISTSSHSLVQAQKPMLFPNPLNDVLNIKTGAEIANVSINNLAGQTIKKFVSTRVEQSFDISDLSAGTYIVTLVMKDGTRFNQKVVKL